MSRDDLINRCPSGAHPRTAIGTAGQPCGRAGPVAIAAWRPDIMPNEDLYNNIIQHDRKPIIINNEKYNELCDNNEKIYKQNFIDSLYK